ncbi:MAG: universal stress protein [Proteobacteria bacterium]|nr:universal stress protein [Pseudomonadota bacterium]
MYQRILVPVDGSETSFLGVDEAIRRARQTGGRLRLVHAIDELSVALAMDAYAGYLGDLPAALHENATAMLAGVKAAASAAGVEADAVLHDSFNDKVADVVATQARQWPADLIVLGTHGRRGMRRLALGSGAESILRTAPVPVLLVRARPQPGTDASAQEHAHVSLPSAALSME